MFEPNTSDPQETVQKFPAVQSLPSTKKGEVIARLLVERGLITEEQLVYAKRVKGN